MRLPSYRKHSSGQARVTINGRDYLLGKFGSAASKASYNRLIAEFLSSDCSTSFGAQADELTIVEILAAYLKHAKTYYGAASREFANLTRVAKPMKELYGKTPAKHFGPAEFKAIRCWWLLEKTRTRQYVNRQMKQTIQIIKWAVSEGMMPPATHQAVKCVEPLKRGRVQAPEAPPIRPVEQATVDATLPHLPQVVADMVRFQLATGCRPGEVCSIKPAMVDRSSDIWQIRLVAHKTAYRGKSRTIYVGPKAQAVLAKYLLHGADNHCFSPREAEAKRREKRNLERTSPIRRSKQKSKLYKKKSSSRIGDHYDTASYGNAIKYACKLAFRAPENPDGEGLKKWYSEHSWAPNQLRHTAATTIRKEFGLDAAAVILGHSGVGVTQVYAEQDTTKAIEVARRIG